MYLVRVSSGAAVTKEAVPDCSEHTLRKLLSAEVTERLRAFESPEAFAREGITLCYYIDGRGGERQLDSNFCGTCLYHTGCPIYGDLLFAAVQDQIPRGMTAAECDVLIAWLCEQFASLSVF